MLRLTLLLAPSLAALATLTACGTNAFESGETKDAAEDATLALERHDETEAIEVLERALDEDPGNPQLLSILSTAYAQRAGIEPLQFATRLASNKVSQNAGADAGASPAAGANGNFTSMFAVMPDATEDHLTDIDRAVSILGTEIATEDRQPGDGFKLALYQTAAVIMHTKALDLNGDGTLSPEEILSLSSNSATGLLSTIASAAVLLGGGAGGDQSQQKAAAIVAKYQTQIDAAPGATQEEKLRNYLAATTGSSEIPTTLPDGTSVPSGTTIPSDTTIPVTQ